MYSHLVKILSVIAVVSLLVSSCEEPDTTAPTVAVIYPAHGTSVSEVVNVTCIATDNVGVEKVELWIDGVLTGLTDDTEPYSFTWNTTQYEDGSTHVITVRADDVNDNQGDSNPVTVTIDQTDAYPTAINITHVSYDTAAMTVTWEKSQDNDFAKYELYSSLDTTNFELLTTIDGHDSTSYSILEFNPQVENYFRVVVYDTLGLSSSGNFLSSTLHEAPNTVAVTNVSYTLSEMTITWETYVADLARIQSMLAKHGQSSSLLSSTDFISYELLYSETEAGNKTSIATITDIDSTVYILTEFDPTHENWFWIKVTDFWGLTSIGIGNTNTIDSSPTAINVTSVDYTLSEMTVIWLQSSDEDFVSYELLYSETAAGTQSSLGVFDNINTTSFNLIEFDPLHENWFWVKVTDYWGLTSTGIGRSNTINSAPTATFNFDPATGSTEAPIDFDASGCSDSEEATNQLRVRWDWESDGIWDTDYTTTKTASHQFSIAGSYSVNMEVQDSWGLADTIQETITVIITVTDIDGNIYETIQIGDQEWMAENLKVTHYRDGTAITNVTDNAPWVALTTEAYCIYNNNVSNEVDTYGALYNWYAVADSRNIAPEGWHVPTDAEWQVLVDYLGGDAVAGGKMKEAGTTHWLDPNMGATNESGFTALPGGYRWKTDGTYRGMGIGGYFWSATEYDSVSAWSRNLGYHGPNVNRPGSNTNKMYGWSVRLLRD